MRHNPTGYVVALAAALILIAAGLLPRDEGASPSPAVRKQGQTVTLTLADWPVTPEILHGKQVYAENCIGCHGQEGKGDGEAARFLNPVPRNFQKGKFKFRSSISGELPFEEDLLRTVTCGLPGASMPGFPLVLETHRKAVVNYVLDIALFGRVKVQLEAQAQEEGMTRDQAVAKLKEMAPAARKTLLDGRKKVMVPEQPKTTPEMLEKGRQLYVKQCANCHGDTGRGDGTSAYALRDWSDAEIRPRDFTTGVFRAGSTAQDIFLRMRTGLNGTPMPSSGENDETLWAIVQHIISLKTPGTIPITRRMGCDHGN